MNLVVAVLIWIMIYPMMVQVDLGSIRDIGQTTQGFSHHAGGQLVDQTLHMAALGWLFFRIFFTDLVDPQTATEYIAGMILLGVAPCTAMVFVWSHLTKGDANYTLVQVSVNDLIMIFAFAPLAGFLLGITDIVVPWETLILSVTLYVVIPLVAGAVTRKALHSPESPERLESLLAVLKPYSIAGLLGTIVLLFGLQAQTILAQPLDIVLIAIPLLIQTYGIFAIAYLAARWWRVEHAIAGPCALIGTSNFFELAVAVAISLFGLHSGAALATVVGVLVEVPVMLSLVAIVNRTRW